jgi:hypothetical protein
MRVGTLPAWVGTGSPACPPGIEAPPGYTAVRGEQAEIAGDLPDALESGSGDVALVRCAGEQRLADALVDRAHAAMLEVVGGCT